MFIISEFQQQYFWEKVIIKWQETQIQGEFDSSFLLSMDSWQLANKAKEAWYILNNNKIPLLEVQKYFGCKEVEIFLEWLNNFLVLNNEDLLTSVILKEVETEEKMSGLACWSRLGVPCWIKDINGARQSRYSALLNDQINIKLTQKPDCFKVAAQDFIGEITKAAQWAADQTISGRVGIIIFDLEQKRSQIDYIFSNFLEEDPYNIALAIKLYNYPFIDIAFLILKISYCCKSGNNIRYEDFSKLLRTRFILGGIDQISFRSNLDYLLREDLDYEFNWQYLIKMLKKIQAKQDLSNSFINNFLLICETFSKELAASNLNVSSKQDCKYWVNFCQKILQIFSWGTANIDEEEQQLVNCWHTLLSQYLELSSVLKQHDLLTFITTLTKLAKEYPVICSKSNHSQNKNSKSITILDLPTAMSLKFDNLWICGLSDVNWPKAYEFNPFLPVELQKKFCLSNEYIEEIVVYRQLLQRLINNTSQLVIGSYPLYVDDHLVRCSSIINDFPELLEELNSRVVTNFLDLTLETYSDDQAPDLVSQQFSGVNFLKLQAACPFKANAKIRLKAISLTKPIPYLSKKLKGEILHKILAKFWGKYKNLIELKSISETKIKEELMTITIKILKKLQRYKPVTLNSFILQIEAQLMVEQCFNFIKKYDLTRDDFAVLYIEEKLVVKLQDLLITIRIDRIDQLPDGSLLVIDYKTGRLLTNKWDDSRMDDPQLPVYSLYSSKIKGLITALIRTEQLKFTGVVTQNFSSLLFKKLDFANIKLTELSDWEDHLTLWHKNLYALANDFKNGVAIVDPKYGAATCRGCDLKYMCREYRS